jgi:CubicO group peptidase (beta-lactamase class C family)
MSTLLTVSLLLGSNTAAAETLRAQIAAYMQASRRIDHFSGAVLVAVHGKVIYSHGFGLANAAAGIANTPATEFRIGSITKQFTAGAILLLRDRGKLRLRDGICRFIPNCPPAWRPITIYELLTHTSGIPNYTSTPGFWHRIGKPITPAKLLSTFEDRPLDFAPGARFSYSNSGYVVLGFIIQRICKEPYRVFLQQNLMLPLGLRHTGYDSGRSGPGQALGYEIVGRKGLRPAPYIDMSWVYSAGALHSTVLDLYRWDRALMAGHLLSTRSVHDMFTSHVPISCGMLGSPARKCGYGFGWMIGRSYNHEEVSHGGEIPGFLSINAFFPHQEVIVIAFDNHFSWVVRKVAKALEAIVFNQPHVIPGAYRSISLSPSALRHFVGLYRITPTFSIVIRRSGDQLYEQAPGQSALPIYPYGPRSFFLKAVDAQITFIIDKHGVINGISLRQDGMDMRGKRVWLCGPARKRHPVCVNAVAADFPLIERPRGEPLASS